MHLSVLKIYLFEFEKVHQLLLVQNPQNPNTILLLNTDILEIIFNYNYL